MRWRVPQFRFVIVAIGVALSGVVATSIVWDSRTTPYNDDAWGAAGGDPALGKVALQTYGCGACHVIPGIRGASGRVGPKLEDLKQQIYVGGVVANSPDNLAAWIVDPQAYSPNTAMPNLGVPEEQARDMAAYLLQQ